MCENEEKIDDAVYLDYHDRYEIRERDYRRRIFQDWEKKKSVREKRRQLMQLYNYEIYDDKKMDNIKNDDKNDIAYNNVIRIDYDEIEQR